MRFVEVVFQKLASGLSLFYCCQDSILEILAGVRSIVLFVPNFLVSPFTN